MKNNTKLILGSLAGVGILGAVTLVLVLTQPETTTESSNSSDSKVDVLSYKYDDISALKIKNENGEFTINRLGSDKWGIDDIPEEYANSTSYANTMGEAAELTAKQLVEENVSELSKYGFDSPTAQFDMTFKDDKSEPVSVVIGDKFSGENSYYVKLGDSNDVYLVGNSEVKFAMGNKLDYVQLAGLTPAYNSEKDVVNRIRVEREDLPNDFVLDLIEEETDKEFVSTYVAYKMSSHGNILADDEKAVDMVYGLFDLAASSAVAVKPTDADKQKYGFDNPTCVVTMVKNEEEVVKLYVGAPIYDVDDDGNTLTSISSYYGMLSGNDVIYTFPIAKLPYVTQQPEDLLYRLIFSPYIYYNENVTVKDSEGKEYVFTITGDADEAHVSLDGKEIELARFKTFYQYLLSTAAEKIYLEPLTEDNKFIASFTYNYEDKKDGANKNGHDTIEVYSCESDRTCILVVNGEVRYKIRQIYGERLINNLNALLNGGDMVAEW